MKRTSYQKGSVICKPRKRGTDVWVFRYMDDGIQKAIPIGTTVAFSETARFVSSVAPLGYSAAISNVTFSEAFGSEPRTAMISSAICTRRILAVAAGTSAVPWKCLGPSLFWSVRWMYQDHFLQAVTNRFSRRVNWRFRAN